MAPTATLANSFTQVSHLGYINSEGCDFAAQSPSGSLIVGSNTIRLTPVPRGVNGTDTGHYLYITGGTGTAEAVLITGGTAISGAATGTVIVTCANTHSGAWTIKSATSGIQEAHNLCSGALMQVFIPSGIWPFYAPAKITKALRIFGAGGANSILQIQSATGGALDVLCDAGLVYSDFRISYASTQQTGGYGIRVNGDPTGYGQNYYSRYLNMHFQGLWVDILNETGYAAMHDNCRHESFGEAGVVLNDTAGTDAEGGKFNGCSFHYLAGATVPPSGIRIYSTGGITITNCSFSGSYWAVLQTGNLSSGLSITCCDVENTLSGCFSGDQYERVSITGCTLSQYFTSAVWYVMFCQSLTGVTFNGNACLTNPGGANHVGVYCDAGCSNVDISGNSFDGFLYAVQTLNGADVTVGPNSIKNVYAGGREVGLGNTSIGSLTCPTTVAGLGGWKDGSVMFATDGTVTSGADNTLAGGGTGALAVRINGVWRAFKAQN